MISIPEPLREWLTSMDGLALSINVGAFIALIYALWRLAKRMWPGLVTFVDFVHALGALPVFMKETTKSLGEMQPVLGEIKHEVFPNNGGSMRDDMSVQELKIDKLSELLNDLNSTVTKLDEHDTNDHKRLEALEALDVELRRKLAARDLSRSLNTGPVEQTPFPVDDTETPHPGR